MFEFLKNILGKPAGEHAGGQAPSTAKGNAAATHKTSSPSPGGAGRTPEARSTRTNGNGNGNGHADSVHIPLQAVLSGLPLELKGRIKQAAVTGATVSISVESVLAQLASGAVKISFGELRRAAPQLFTPEKDRDQILVALPLNEILSQIKPTSIGRRQQQ